MNDKASGIYAMGIHLWANQMQTSFNKRLHCHKLLVRMQITRVLCIGHAVVFLCLLRKLLFRYYLMIFKCALEIWLCSLTAEVSDVPCTGEFVSLLWRLETVWPFLEYIKSQTFKPQYPHTNSPNWSLYISLRNKLREFGRRSKHFLLGDHFINSHNHFSW